MIAMWVEPESRGLGGAESSLIAFKCDTTSRGFKEVFLDVSPDNLKALRFYKKHGFVFTGEEKPLASHPKIQVHTMKWKPKWNGSVRK